MKLNFVILHIFYISVLSDWSLIQLAVMKVIFRKDVIQN